jgi:hypothetical protein
LVFMLIVMTCTHCNNRDRNEYKDMESLMMAMGKSKFAQFDKYPPRLVKMFIRFEKGDNSGLIGLLDMTDQFMVLVHDKKSPEGAYKNEMSDIRHQLKRESFNKSITLDLDEIIFKQYIKENDGTVVEMVLEIDEPEYHTLYLLKGHFSKEDVLNTNKTVAPIEFLKLNMKIRQK